MIQEKKPRLTLDDLEELIQSEREIIHLCLRKKDSMGAKYHTDKHQEYKDMYRLMKDYRG